MPTLTVIIPTFNEEAYLKQALKSVYFADEIIVIDSFSNDRTIEIAKSFNCKVISRVFDNFSNQKNHALIHATGDWVLFIDADERITYQLKEAIIDAINNGKHAGYKLYFPHFYMNRFLYNHSDFVTRLVLKSGCEFKGDVHEKLIVNGSIGKLNTPVLHFTYKGLVHYISKKDTYSWLQAKELFDKNKKASYFYLFFKPLYRFFSSYILRRGFLDGIPGLAVASINAYGVFSRYVKLILLKKNIR